MPDLLLAGFQDPQKPLPPPPPVSAPADPQAGGTEGAPGTQAPGGQEPAPPPGGLGSLLLPFAILILFMWFFVIRPERKRQRQRRALLSQIEKGDKVVTAGGLHGTIVRLDEHTVVLKVDDNVRLKFDRSAIGRIASAQEEGRPAAVDGQAALAGARK